MTAKKKFLVWLPNTPRQEPHVIHADSWHTTPWDEGGTRTTFKIGTRNVGIVVGDVAIFEGVGK